MSDTPRTDAEIAECDETLPFTLAAKDRGASLYGQTCRASFARQLERELAFFAAENKTLARALNDAHARR